jgi:hypothetical protein
MLSEMNIPQLIRGISSVIPSASSPSLRSETTFLIEIISFCPFESRKVWLNVIQIISKLIAPYVCIYLLEVTYFHVPFRGIK